MLENPEKEYDVIVVGIGPAGSSVARYCGEKGLKVLAVEKRQEIGVPVRCGEGLSKSSLERMGIGLEKSWVAKMVKGAAAYAPNGKKITVDFKGPEGWVIERKMFDKYLAKLAAKGGAKIITKTEVVGVERKGSEVNVKMRSGDRNFETTCKILVACDGVESRIARMMGMKTTLSLNDIASCVQFEMTNVKIDPDRIEMYFGKEIAPGGYAWVFPKGKETANVGIGVRKPFSKKHAIEYLRDFVRKREGLRNGSVIEVNSGGVPVGGLLEDMVSDNFLIVGDAAHQVNPIHGGGISESYIAGKIAGEVIVKAIKKGNYSKVMLSEYNKKWWETRGKKMEKLLRLRRVVESLSDEELNWLVNYLKGEDLINLARSSGFKKLGFILMKKPRLITIARKLV
ncbi:MAG: geranylgeranyl reductase family protein [Candidatus Aenigmarchaeota archaeon]|nr:geranylgeranyl reductase family protein [Candidatus Aenigmarchaeota archaeon]NIP40120.1 geranylgeranyl reductase family protein [Candidatus Aenigmarchaeota archaeon]NIQ18197.1 geranylgeranyl reductase family protein [Candidatus Aenigmarchaeota archaeon]NIS72954.1 geranylgeranyl reductase family protein [Candidatus Aenigmarchaeota archaeon]